MFVVILDFCDGLNVKRMKLIKIKVIFLFVFKLVLFIIMEFVVIVENVKGMIKGVLRNE